MSRADDLNPNKPVQIFVAGRKGTGKTELAWTIFDSYPYDKLVIDPNGDIKVGENVVEIDSADLPSRWPVQLLERKKSQTLLYVPDFKKRNYLDDIDHMVGIAYDHGRTMVLVDEAHEAIPAGKTPPHSRRALRQGRHRDLSSIWVTPRPKTIDPLAIANADIVYVFDLRNPDDRKRVAETIGMDPKDVDEAIAALGPHEYLRYLVVEDDLAHFDALPAEMLSHHHG